VSTDYVRTGAAFAIIAVLLSSGAIFFTWYSISEPRYMFKRLAGSLHLITGMYHMSGLELPEGAGRFNPQFMSTDARF